MPAFIAAEDEENPTPHTSHPHPNPKQERVEEVLRGLQSQSPEEGMSLPQTIFCGDTIFVYWDNIYKGEIKLDHPSINRDPNAPLSAYRLRVFHIGKPRPLPTLPSDLHSPTRSPPLSAGSVGDVRTPENSSPTAKDTERVSGNGSAEEKNQQVSGQPSPVFSSDSNAPISEEDTAPSAVPVPVPVPPQQSQQQQGQHEIIWRQSRTADEILAEMFPTVFSKNGSQSQRNGSQSQRNGINLPPEDAPNGSAVGELEEMEQYSAAVDNPPPWPSASVKKEIKEEREAEDSDVDVVEGSSADEEDASASGEQAESSSPDIVDASKQIKSAAVDFSTSPGGCKPSTSTTSASPNIRNGRHDPVVRHGAVPAVNRPKKRKGRKRNFSKNGSVKPVFGNPFTCEVSVCGQTFSAYSMLKNHLIRRHNYPKDTGKGLIGCKTCGGLFPSKKELFKHQRESHR